MRIFPLCVLGHSQMLNHVSWSHDGQWLITSSDDKSAKLWMSSNPEPVMTIANVKGNIAVSKEAGSKPDKVRFKTYKAEVSKAATMQKTYQRVWGLN